MSTVTKVWYIPDAYLASPDINEPLYKNHEAVCVLNTTEADAHLLLDLYFPDRDPHRDIAITVPANRCYHIRLDDPAQLGGVMIPFDVPYGIRIRSNVEVVIQYSRLYATTPNVSVMTTIAYAE